MAIAHSKITARGMLGVGPGSVLEWKEEGGNVVISRAGKFSSEDIHRELFTRRPKKRSLAELKNRIRQYVRKRYASS